jgi:hypothetical protein
LQKLYDEDDIFIYHLEKNENYFLKVCELERSTGSPVSVEIPEFPKDETTWISKPGLHLGFDEEEAVIFAVRIK